LDHVLADPQVDIIANLTIHKAHAEVVTACLEAGKHVYSEKPMAMTYAESKRLVERAAARGVRLSSAPISYMGEAQQTAFKLIREGKTGPVRVVYAEVNHGRIEKWHPNPVPFYEVGPLWDAGIYPLTLITAFLGPARRVRGFAKVLFPDRVTRDGVPFHVETPEFNIGIIELENGTVVRLTSNFYVSGSKQGGSLEFIGDDGLVYLSNFMDFAANVEYRAIGEDYEPVDLLRPVSQGCKYARGLEELADAILNGRPHRASGAHAAHVVEIIEGILRSAASGHPVDISSTFTPPAPMDWASVV
jgi:predicted dehydrogenase